MADHTAPLSPTSAAPPLVGRERERAVLRDALAAALAGRGSLVLIGGEAGIGKTALAEATLAVASAQGALTLTGRCYDLAETPPYGPWTEALALAPEASDLPALPAALLAPERGGEALTSQDAVVRRVREYLDALAASRPLVLLLDDLHWADPASLDLLRVTGRHLASASLLLLVTYRDDELADAHPLAAILPTLVRESRATRLSVSRLGADEVRALARARYRLSAKDETRLAGYLDARAEGNPLFLGELLRSLEENGTLRRAAGEVDAWALGDLSYVRVPLLLRQIIGGRASRLGERAGRLLGVAATIGQAVPLDLWGVVAGADDEELGEAVEQSAAAHMLTETPDGVGVRFAHALVREALYEAIPLPRRRALHRRVAEVLLVTPAPDPDTVAYHLRQGGDARMVRWMLHSADRAERACAWLTAAERIEAALADSPAGGLADEERAWQFFRLARLRRYDDTRRALEHLEEGARHADALGDRALQAYARFYRGLLHWFAGDYTQGGIDLEAGVAALDGLSPGERERLLHREIGESVLDSGAHYANFVAFLAEVGRYTDALEMAKQVLQRVDGHPVGGSNDHALADTYLGMALTHAALGQPDEALDAYDRAHAAYRASGNYYLAAMTLTEELQWAVLPFRAEELAARQRLAADAERILTAAQTIRADFPPRLARLPLLFLEGEWAEIRALAPSGEEVPSGETFINLGVLGALASATGNVALGERIVASALPAGPATEPGTAVLTTALALQRVAAGLSLDRGDPAGARAWLEAHERWLAWSGAVLGRAEDQLCWSSYYRALGDLQRARERANEAVARAGEPRQPLALLAAHRLLGELDTGAGRHLDAAAHLDVALALSDDCAAPYERALTLLAGAELHLAAGRREAVVWMLAEAQAILARLQARPALARCVALAARQASGVDLPLAPHPAGLTAREVEVLRLIATGLSNREMAEDLCRSERTIERHIENIYRKIDAHNKADATAFAFRHGLA